ncbi:DsbA family protein [Streptomyces chryseus]
MITALGLSVGACADPRDSKPNPYEKPAGYSAAADLPEALSDDGTTVVVGNPRAPRVVRVYEDMRCPVCGEFEVEGASADLRELTLLGDVRTEYVLASFLDDRLGGSGSKRAANALRAALEQDRFVEYHAVLFANQPAEATDGYTDDFLLRMASQVPGLRGPAFDSAVKKGEYDRFVYAAQQEYATSAGGRGTPAMDVDGKPLPDGERGVLFTRGTLLLYLATHES